MIQPARVAFNERAHLGQPAAILHPELFETAKALSQKNSEQMRQAEAEGMSQFYEEMAGVALSDIQEAYKQCRDKILDLQRRSNDEIRQSHQDRMRFAEAHRALEPRLNALERTEEFPTREKHITLPNLLTDTQSEYAKYYYDGVPQGLMTASAWLMEVRQVDTEVEEVLNHKEEPHQEIAVEEKNPAETGTASESTRKSFWDRLRGK